MWRFIFTRTPWATINSHEQLLDEIEEPYFIVENEKPS